MSTTVRRVAGNPWRRTFGRVLVLVGDEIHELSGGAALVWEQIEVPSSIDKVCDSLLTTATATATREEIRAAVELLIERGLVEASP